MDLVAGHGISNPVADVIFVSGLHADWRSTWCSATDRNVLWPRDLLPDELPTARILCFSYVGLLSEPNVAPISRRLRDALSQYLRERERDVPIVFVAHSLGGLILQEAIYLEPKDSDPLLLPHLRGICLLGTPRFRDETKWNTFSRFIASQTDAKEVVAPSAISEYGTTINANFEAWLSARQRFPIEICCFYEIQKTSNEIGILVPQDAAVIPGQEARPLLKDHLSLTKHGDRLDSQYLMICERLQPMVGNGCSFFNSLSGLVFIGSENLQTSSRNEELKHLTTSQEQQGAISFALALHSEGHPKAAEQALFALLEEVSDHLAQETHLGFFICSKISTTLRENGRLEDSREVCELLLGQISSSPVKSPAKSRSDSRYSQGSVLLANHGYVYAADFSSNSLGEVALLAANQRSDPIPWHAITKLTNAASTRSRLMTDETAQVCASLCLTLRCQKPGSQIALRLSIEALEYLEDVGNSSPTRIVLIRILAKLCQDKGYSSLAELLMTDILLDSIDRFGPVDRLSLCCGSDLSSVLCRRGEFNLAEKFATHTLDMLEKTLGRDHPDCLKAFQRLAYIKLSQRRYNEACSDFENLLSRQRGRLNPHHRRVFSTLSALGVCYLLQGRSRKGELFLRNASRNQQEAFGNHDHDYLWTSAMLRAVQKYKSRLLESSSAQVTGRKAVDSPRGGALSSAVHAERRIIPAISFETKRYHEQNLRDDIEAVLTNPPSLRSTDFDDSFQSLPLLSTDSSLFGAEVDDDVKLRCAAFHGQTAFVRSLLKQGANPDAVGGFYGSSMHAAAFSGNEETVELLLAIKASVDLEGGICGTALRAAAFRGHKNIVLRLLRAGAHPNNDLSPEKSALKVAIAMNHQDIVAVLLKHGADKHSHDKIYGTALHEATVREQANMVKYLLDEEVDVNPNVRAGIFKTAIEASAWAGSAITTELLLRRGSSLDERFEGGRALHLAKSRGHVDVVNLLKRKMEERRQAKAHAEERSISEQPKAMSTAATQPSDPKETKSLRIPMDRSRRSLLSQQLAPPPSRSSIFQSLATRPLNARAAISRRQDSKRLYNAGFPVIWPVLGLPLASMSPQLVAKLESHLVYSPDRAGEPARVDIA